MSEEKQRRIRRPVEERVLELDMKREHFERSLQDLEAKKQDAMLTFDAKITKVKGKIALLEEKKHSLLFPKSIKRTRRSKKQKIQELIKQAQKTGMKPEEIASRLDLSL